MRERRLSVPAASAIGGFLFCRGCGQFVSRLSQVAPDRHRCDDCTIRPEEADHG